MVAQDDLASYQWDPEKKRYLHIAGSGGTPEVIPPKELVAVRDAFTAAQQSRARDLARIMFAESGEGLRVDAFRPAFNAMIEETFSANYLLGRGGLNAMALDDFRQIERLVTEQFNFADRFYRVLEDAKGGEKLSEDQVAERAAAYMGSSVQAFEEAMAAGAGIDLPAYPADGSTECMYQCRCTWEIEETDAGYSCTWITEQDERVCPTCEERGRAWNPLILPKGNADA